MCLETLRGGNEWAGVAEGHQFLDGLLWLDPNGEGQTHRDHTQHNVHSSANGLDYPTTAHQPADQ